MDLNHTRKIAIIALLSALSIILTFIEFSIPIFPSFLRFDFSDIPAVISAFFIGYGSGIIIIFIKNLFSLFSSSTMGIGEFCNFILGISFVVTSCYMYSKNKTRKNALISMLLGTGFSCIVAVIINYYIVVPVYSLIVPMNLVFGMCKLINPYVDSLFDIIMFFILPFSVVKGLMVSFITFFLYNKLSAIMKYNDL